MTSLVCWVGVDSRGPASVYLASDSRISWGASSHRFWDVGRKLFASRSAPELLGYVGQVLFPSQVLPQVIDLVDTGLLFNLDSNPDLKHRAIFRVIQRQFDSYPVERNRTFTIVHCSRYGSGLKARFHISTLRWEHSSWHEEVLEIPTQSTVVRAWGSGGDMVERRYEEWVKAQGQRTSRNVFSAFCDALESTVDQFTGGAPQLLGLYRKDAGRTLGVVYRGALFFNGIPLHDPVIVDQVEWRNELFERCGGHTGARLEGAQPHGRPRGLR